MIFALLVDIVEVSQHFYGRDVRTGIIDNTFTPVLDQVFQELQCLRGYHVRQEGEVAHRYAHLVYLSPLTSLFLHIARVNGGHDFVELLAGNIIEKARGVDDGQTHKLKVLQRRGLTSLAGSKREETVFRHTLGQFLASMSSSLPFRSV